MTYDPSTPPPGANPPGYATQPPPGGTPPAGFPPPGGPNPGGSGGGGGAKGLIIAIIVVASLLVVGIATAAVLILTGGDDDDTDTQETSQPTDDPSDDPTDEPTDDEEEVDLDDGPWVDTVEDFTVAYYDADCAQLMELAPSTWPDEASCLAEVKPGQFTLEDYDIETTELDDEQDPAEAIVEIDYTIIQVSTDQAQTYVTTFTVIDEGGDWVVSAYTTG